MNFRHVFAYAAGKADWMAYGLPVERGPDAPQMVGELMVRDVPRCHPESPVGAARDAAYEMGMDVCPVVNEEGVLLGLCTRSSLHAHPSIAVELVMEPGPVTVRPNVPIEEALRILERRKGRPLLVTTPDGKLIGCLDPSAAAEGDGKAAAI
jgi:CBS domain-containing protein